MTKNKTQALIELFQGLHALLKAGLDLVPALTLQIQHRQSFARELTQITVCLREGQSLSHAFQQYLTLPYQLQVYLRLGENTGDLVQACQFCINTLENHSSWRRMLWQIGFYPVLLLCTSISLFGVMMGFVLPEFASLYQTLNVELPRSTAWLLHLANWAPSLFIVVGILSVGMGILLYWSWHQPRGRFTLERTFTQVPILKHVIAHHYQYQIAHQLGSLLHAGSPLVEAIEFMREATQSPFFEQYLRQVQQRLQQGQSLRMSFCHGWNQDHTFKALLTYAEQTGQLDRIFTSLATQHKETMQQWQDKGKHMIQPIITLIMGGFLGIWILLLYYPMLQLGTNLG